MAGKGRGFKGIVITRGTGSEEVAQLRRGIRRDMKRAMAKMDEAESRKDDAQNKLLQNISLIEAWNKWQAVQTNGIQRLGELARLQEQSGTNVGRIVIPATWDAKAQQIVATMLNTLFGLQMDVINGFAADRAVTLWTLLASELGMHNLTDSLFGGIMFLQFLGGGLSVGPLFNLPGTNPFTNVVIPRLVSDQLAVISR